jgi:hypothetical protein
VVAAGVVVGEGLLVLVLLDCLCSRYIAEIPAGSHCPATEVQCRCVQANACKRA